MKPALPDLPTITLMQPTLVAQPVHRDGWVYEEKYDGWRMVAYKAGDTVQLVSRPGRDHAKRFPLSWRRSAAWRRPR
jgi:ATP-dependent DNA ligase